MLKSALKKYQPGVLKKLQGFDKTKLAEMRNHCMVNFFKKDCSDCKFKKECEDINTAYIKLKVCGKEMGYFYLSDIPEEDL